MAKTHQEFLSEFDDERKSLVQALLVAINEECPCQAPILYTS
jgi:hypothetical protein